MSVLETTTPLSTKEEAQLKILTWEFGMVLEEYGHLFDVLTIQIVFEEALCQYITGEVNNGS